MQTAVLSRASAEIIPFARKRSPLNRLTLLDRVHALEWDVAEAIPSGARLTIHACDPADGSEFGDYIGIYRAGESWTLWGAARDGAQITVWHGPSGSDLGYFATMREALCAVSYASVRLSSRRSRRKRV